MEHKQKINRFKERKAQQEIVGFIIIVLMVIIAGVIFLSISLRPQKTMSTDDVEIENFLVSTEKFTTDCYITSIPAYKNLQDLSKDCRNQPTKTCDNGKNVCQVLNDSYSQIIKRIWLASNVGSVKYYQLKIYYQGNLSDPTTKTPPFINITSGNLTGCLTRKAGQSFTPSEPGDIVTELELCRSG